LTLEVNLEVLELGSKLDRSHCTWRHYR